LFSYLNFEAKERGKCESKTTRKKRVYMTVQEGRRKSGTAIGTEKNVNAVRVCCPARRNGGPDVQHSDSRS